LPGRAKTRFPPTAYPDAAIALGSQVSHDWERSAPVDTFLDMCAHRKWIPAFYQVESPARLPDCGLTA